jgi:hypothetical protein
VVRKWLSGEDDLWWVADAEIAVASAGAGAAQGAA